MLTRNLLVKSLLGAIQTETPESAATGKPTSAPEVDPRNFWLFSPPWTCHMPQQSCFISSDSSILIFGHRQPQSSHA